MASLCQSKSVTKQISTTPSINVESDEKLFQEIEKLQNVGVNAADITKLKAAGFCTILSIIQSTKKEICNIKGVSEAKVDKIFEAAQKIELSNGFVTGSDIFMKRTKLLKITTGSKQLDLTLGGGIESMSITELFGENRTGKTQICHTMCVTAQLARTSDGGEGKVCYIDTENTFRPEKIMKIAERFNLDPDQVLDNIIYARAYTNEHLISLIAMAAAKMCEENFSMLIIDSIMALFRVDFSGRGELAERQQRLNKCLSQLQKLAEQFNLAILLTNHVMSDPGAGMSFIANPTKPVGGHVLGHASTTRLSLRKGKGDQRVCKIYDAPNLPECECTFQLSEGGVIDPSD